MIKFNKSKISRLFLTFFAMSLFNVSCMAEDPVKFGEVSYFSESSEASDASDSPNYSNSSVSLSNKVAVNTGAQVESGLLSSGSTGLSNLEQTNDGDMGVEFGENPLTSLDGYILKGNAVNYGEKRHLVTYDSVPPVGCDLYVRAIKIKDGLGRDIAYDPDTTDTTNDSGWIKYEGRATFDHLASTIGLWHTFAVRYKGQEFKNDYDVKYVVLDKSRSTDGINRYTLLDSNHKVILPDVGEASESTDANENNESVISDDVINESGDSSD